MKRIRIIGPCLVAVLALGALTAASASAEEFHETARYENCSKTTHFNGHQTGLYTEKDCVTLSGTHEGKYELSGWRPEETSTFKSHGGESIFYFYVAVGAAELTPGGSGGVVWQVECAKSKGAGEITAARKGWIELTYSKCTGHQEPGGASVACKGASGNGDIQTGKLQYELESFFYNGGEVKPAAELAINEGSSTYAEFKCGAATFELKDDLGRPEVALLNACSDTMTLSFKVGSGGEPEPWEPEPETGNGPGSAAYWPRAEVNGDFFGVGLESTETLRARQRFCVFNQFPKEG